MSDLIERQKAIEAIYETFCYAYCDNCEKEMNEDLCGDCHRKYQNWSASKKTIEKVINNLPSEQPEIIHCKDCKHFGVDRYKKLTWCSRINYGYGYQADDFCSRAERRTDERPD